VTDQPAPPPERTAEVPQPPTLEAPAESVATPEPTPEPVDRWADPTPPRRPRPNTGPVQYKGDDLSVAWNWPSAASAALLFAVIGLLLITGQTIIFLLRLVAADRRGRRRPLASETKTVGELEDERSDRPSD